MEPKFKVIRNGKTWYDTDTAVPVHQNFARLGYYYRSHKMTNREEINSVVLFYSNDFVATILTY